MSNFVARTRHIKTGEVVDHAEWLDDHFGRHRYGVRFPGGRIYRGEECEVIDDQSQDAGRRSPEQDGGQ